MNHKLVIKGFAKRRTQIRLACLALFFAINTSASTGTLVSDASLKSTPDFKASELAKLKKESQVNVLQRKRGWYQVEAPEEKTGWLTLLQLRFEKAINVSEPSDLSRFIGLRKGHNNITATTGVRGIGEKDIKNAKADFNGLEISRQFYIPKASARTFAQEGGLASQAIEYKEKKDEN